MAIVIPYTRQTWTDGSGGGTPLSAARLAVIEEGVVDVSQAPAVRVFHSATQSATNGVALVLAFNSERFDQAGGAASTQHDTVTNNSRLTALYAGIYQISGFGGWAASPVNTTIAIRLNGTTQIDAMSVVGDYRNMSLGGTLWSMAVNDYVELLFTQNSGGALNVSANPEFMMVRVA